jgi:hypothetical protein
VLVVVAFFEPVFELLVVECYVDTLVDRFNLCAAGRVTVTAGRG